MRKTELFRLSLASILLLGSAAVFAQDTTQDEVDVWAQVVAAWNADQNGDREWPEQMLSDDFSGWENNAPVPLNKSSIKMWDRFNEQTGKMVAHELYPYTIVIHNDVAVAHYFYTSAFKAKDGEITKSNGRYTDVLVRSEDGWKILAWHGGDDE